MEDGSPGLSQEPDRGRIVVFFPVAGLHGGDDDAGKPGNQDDRQNDKSDQHEAEAPCDQAVDRVGNLEVEHLFAGGIDLRTVGALHEPDDQGNHDMSEGKTEDESREPREMQSDAPGAVGFGNLWGGGSRWSDL